jgi:hypothetical protein
LGDYVGDCAGEPDPDPTCPWQLGTVPLQQTSQAARCLRAPAAVVRSRVISSCAAPHASHSPVNLLASNSIPYGSLCMANLFLARFKYCFLHRWPLQPKHHPCQWSTCRASANPSDTCTHLPLHTPCIHLLPSEGQTHSHLPPSQLPSRTPLPPLPANSVPFSCRAHAL